MKAFVISILLPFSLFKVNIKSSLFYSTIYFKKSLLSQFLIYWNRKNCRCTYLLVYKIWQRSISHQNITTNACVHVQLLVTSQAVAHQVPLSVGFSRQENVISSSRESCQSRGQTHVSCVSCFGSGLFTTLPPGKPNNKYSMSKIKNKLKQV